MGAVRVPGPVTRLARRHGLTRSPLRRPRRSRSDRNDSGAGSAGKLPPGADIGHPWRTLDALRLASAVLLSDGLTAFIAYDQRLASAARAAGLVVVTPGRDEA
jgi:hypothetical protein